MDRDRTGRDGTGLNEEYRLWLRSVDSLLLRGELYQHFNSLEPLLVRVPHSVGQILRS